MVLSDLSICRYLSNLHNHMPLRILTGINSSYCYLVSTVLNYRDPSYNYAFLLCFGNMPYTFSYFTSSSTIIQVVLIILVLNFPYPYLYIL